MTICMAVSDSIYIQCVYMTVYNSTCMRYACSRKSTVVPCLNIQIQMWRRSWRRACIHEHTKGAVKCRSGQEKCTDSSCMSIVECRSGQKNHKATDKSALYSICSQNQGCLESNLSCPDLCREVSRKVQLSSAHNKAGWKPMPTS